MTKSVKSVGLLLFFCTIINTSFVSSFIQRYDINKNGAKPITNSELSVLTLNTWALPLPFHKSFNKKRYDKIIDQLNKSNYNIICLQETFNKSFREKLAANIDKKFNVSGDPYCTRKSIFDMDCFGGLITLTTRPIIEEAFFKYEITDEYSVVEKTGSKGFLLTILGINGDTVGVINTHLYSGSSVNAEKMRLKQLEFMNKIISQNKKYAGMPLLFAGDFNIGHPDQYSHKVNCVTYDFLTKKMKLMDSMPKLCKGDYSYDHSTNFYAPKDEPVQKLDYIFMNHSCKKMSFRKANIVFNKENSISDHSGVEVKIHLTNYKNKLNYYAAK
jgi:endonuclease/exonuclease/phosphatase family metal-dependent hydrolase